MRPDPRHYADAIVFWMVVVLCIGLFGFLWGEHRYREGIAEGQKRCAEVPGKQIVSTSPTGCTYANAYGRATESRRAR